ncbi:phospholipase A2-like protein [Amycolatopsis echigonensis]|uniref:Phospholipase A2-like protein n=1 Tax=Amycolatopsis echigonensis TaxID=2576905 RepID=A0A2N3WM09_9PSEU|nr:phospholipase A2 [Amycolatopsis niigatensis]PKV94914.1 phospholipase A2-like protein [Amycolatopsis niigatensis]
MPATDDRAPAAVRVRRPLSTSGWLLLVLLVVFGFGLIASRPASPPDQGPPTGGVLAAQNAVDALAHPGGEATALALLPKDFTAVTGVKPGALPARDGTVRAAHLDGGCSAPWGDDNTKWDFSVPCKAHDLGYDLLRYANDKGHPLGQSARAALDDRLEKDMHRTCELNPMNSERTCQLVASVFTSGLVVNSWHQRWGPPVGDPIGPIVAGVLVIGCLLVMRLRGWHTARRTTPRPRLPRGVPRPWAVLGVAGAVLLTVGESATALADWAGAPESTWWPLTWLAQLTPLLFFAGGLANAAGWRAERDRGYRHYVAERSSPLLRPALIFAVVALIVPLALELLGIPAGTNATVMRIALHPLWLLGVYLLTVVGAPMLLALYLRTRLWSVAALTAIVVAGELAASWTDVSWPRYAATLALALLAQQVAFAYSEGVRLRRSVLAIAAVSGVAALTVAVFAFDASPVLLGNPGAPAALSARPWTVLLLGVSQLGLIGLLATPLRRWAARDRVTRTAALVLRAPMSLYLAFLAAMLLLVAVVYLPGPIANGLSWLLRPRMLAAVALLLVPAALVFWWFERHPGKPGKPRIETPVVPLPHTPTGRRSVLLTRAAAALGIGYATLGVFGLALARFGAEAADADVLGLRLDPVQSLVHLLLGVLLLHAVRTGAAATSAATWFAAALTCVPSLVAAAGGETHGSAVVVLHLLTAAFALVGAGSCMVPTRRAATATP